MAETANSLYFSNLFFNRRLQNVKQNKTLDFCKRFKRWISCFHENYWICRKRSRTALIVWKQPAVGNGNSWWRNQPTEFGVMSYASIQSVFSWLGVSGECTFEAHFCIPRFQFSFDFFRTEWHVNAKLRMVRIGARQHFVLEQMQWHYSGAVIM